MGAPRELGTERDDQMLAAYQRCMGPRGYEHHTIWGIDQEYGKEWGAKRP